MINQYLPIGTVVLLKGASKKMMVLGYAMKDKDGKYYDFIGTMWPEGMIAPNRYSLFNLSEKGGLPT